MATSECQCAIRQAKRSDIPVIKKLLDADEWDEYDTTFLTCMFDLDCSGWFVAYQREAEEVVGALALMRINEKLTAGGILIVKESMRGRGVARAFKGQVERLIGNSSVVLSANSVDLYKNRGFTYDYDIKYIRVNIGVLIAAIPNEITGNISVYENKMFTNIEEYDSDMCMYKRSKYLKKWILEAADCVLVAHTENGCVSGYGCCRKLGGCNFIGPLYADSVDIAWSLLRRLLQGFNQDSNIDMFVTSVNEPLKKLFDTLSVRTIVCLHRMHSRDPVNIKTEHVYCISHLGFTVI